MHKNYIWGEKIRKLQLTGNAAEKPTGKQPCKAMEGAERNITVSTRTVLPCPRASASSHLEIVESWQQATHARAEMAAAQQTRLSYLVKVVCNQRGAKIPLETFREHFKVVDLRPGPAHWKRAFAEGLAALGRALSRTNSAGCILCGLGGMFSH